MRRRFLLLLGIAACNRVFGIENTGVLPPEDAAIAPDGDPRIDLDRDGLKDVEDPCIAPDTDLMVDTDADGILNGVDLCPLDKAATGDTDGDGIGDLCDPTADENDRVRCVMAFTDPELDLAMWHRRDESPAWTLYYPRSLAANGQGSIVADWSFESPNVTTYSIAGYVYTSGNFQTKQLDILVRGARTPDPTDVGCSLVSTASGTLTTWSLVTSDGTSAQLPRVASPIVSTKFFMTVTIEPRANDGVTLRCRANFEGNVSATVQQVATLPVGSLAFSTSGFSGIHGIVVYERDDAPP